MQITPAMKYYSTLILSAIAMTCMGCSDDTVEPTSKDWDNTATLFETTDAARFDTYYKPQVGYVGDPMPFYDPQAKDFKIFYLQEFRPNSTTFHPFWCLTTTDAASYQSLGEVIPTGSITDLDGALGTGCTVYNDADRTYYTFYTGHSCDVASTGIGEGVMMATSQDCRTLRKNPAFMLLVLGEYSTSDFRDPCVFKDDAGLYHMLVSTQKSGKGVIAEYTSTDLNNWTSAGVFMTMMWDRFYECPDVFRMGDWWYMVYSEKHAAVRRVQYFKGRTLEELKSSTANDAGLWPDYREGMLDSRAFYAGKTASDGTDRYIWGWCPTRPGSDNTNVGAYPAEPEWAGALVALKLIQHPDGTLTLGRVDGIIEKYSQPMALKVMNTEGQATADNSGYSLSGDASVLFNRLGSCNRIEFTATATSPDAKFGVSLVRGIDSARYYSMVVNPEGSGRHKINFEEEGPEGCGFVNGADGYVFDTPADNTYRITIINDNSVCTMYINDDVAFTARVYGIRKNCWSINSYGSDIRISDLHVYQAPE